MHTLDAHSVLAVLVPRAVTLAAWCHGTSESALSGRGPGSTGGGARSRHALTCASK